MPRLGVIIGSVRQGGVGRPITDWFIERAQQHGKFEVQRIDLKAIDLPLFAERTHPRLKQYENDKQKAWSALITSMDAFVLVTPEYNYSPPPALLNALDYVSGEWAYKPAAFVSYGGISGGLRAVQSLKLTLQALRMVAIVEAVTIPFVSQLIDKEAGRFKANEQHDRSAAVVLDELLRWTGALAPLRS